MRIIEKEFNKNGFLYKEVKRDANIAIYEQIDVENDIRLAYEVFKVVVMKPNNFIPEHFEKFPSNEDFGKTAWSFRKYDKAIDKFNFLKEKSLKAEADS